MGLLHFLTNSLVVACQQSIADSQDTILLAQYKVSTGVVLFAYLGANLFELLPSAVAQSLELALWMFLGNSLHYVLAGVATVVVW